MGCCGGKRLVWLDRTKSISKDYSSAEEFPKSIADRFPKIYENIEDSRLVFKREVTGKNFFFEEKGHRIHVDFIDSFAMRAEVA